MLAQHQDSLDRTEIHDVLSNRRRCLVIETLERNGAMTLRDLANDIAVVETDEDPAPRPARQSVYVTLHQSHLPKLDRLGIVEYDTNSKHVRLGDRIEDVRVYLKNVESNTVSLGEFQLGLALLGLMATLSSALGVPVLETVPPVLYATGTVFVLALALGLQQVKQPGPRLEKLVGRRQKQT